MQPLNGDNMKNIVYYLFLLMLCFCSKANAGMFLPPKVEPFPAMKYTTDWVHAVEAKDDLRQFDSSMYNKDDFYAALERQPIVWIDRTYDVTLHHLEFINTKLNAAYKFADDKLTYGKTDYTATPFELIKKGQGDCEDFSLLKYHALAGLGFTADKLNIYSGYYIDVATPVAHSVLAVELSDGKEYVLDVMLNEPMLASDYMNRFFKPMHRITNQYVSAY